MKKTVLITGASRGIGAETARVFAANNYNVVINYLNSDESAKKLTDELINKGCDAMCIKCDISNTNDVEKMVDSILKKYKNIDVLVNNAGISEYSLFTDITEQQWDRMMNINVKGVFNCTKAVLPNMISNKYGKIINISSMWGVTGGSCEVHYSASKAAVIGLTKALAKEVGLSNINVNCVAPGVIQTDMCKDITPEIIDSLKEETPINRLGQPNDIAQTVLFLASDNASFITGQVIGANGGFVI